MLPFYTGCSYIWEKKLYERPVRPLCKQVPLFNYWSKKESGKTPGKDTKLQKVTESSNMICVDSLGFAVLRHFCCHSNGKHYVMHECFQCKGSRQHRTGSQVLLPRRAQGICMSHFPVKNPAASWSAWTNPTCLPVKWSRNRKLMKRLHIYI